MADVGRITELWREAADALERTERERTLEVIQAVDAIAHLRKQRDELQAERDRLREQLDAAPKGLERIAAHPHGGILVNIARAALGVVGEPAETSPTIGERESNSRGTGQVVAPPAPSLALQDLISAAGNAARVFTAFVSETDEDLIPMYHEVQEAAEGFQAAAAALGVVGEQE